MCRARRGLSANLGSDAPNTRGREGRFPVREDGAKDNKYLWPLQPVGSLKVIVGDEVEKQFRRVAMRRYGYGKGALSEAAEAALGEWSSREDTEVTLPPGLEDPVAAVEGLLKHVGATSVELQHEASRIRVKKASAETSS